MKRVVFHLLVMLWSFAIAVFVVWFLSPIAPPTLPEKGLDVTVDTVSSKNETNPSSSDDYKEALGDVWIDNETTRFHGYLISRKCALDRYGQVPCTLDISRRGKKLKSFESEQGRRDWLKYGFFSFLGANEKQLVVHTYSGGAHCCYDYYIFDLGAKFRTLYDSSRYDSANEIGNELVPVDIDKDGVFEFYQSVMAFDYMAEAGHSTATFPPAIFAYEKVKRRYVLAESKYPRFILDKMQEELDGLGKWGADYEKRSGEKFPPDELDEIAVRTQFLYMVYAGKRNQGWRSFEKNYRTKSGSGYQDEFRKQFIREFKRSFSKDPTYKSVYP